MIHDLRLHQAVSGDIAAVANYLALDDQKVADRFVRHTLDTFAKLTAMPGLGSPRSFRSRTGAALRSIAVPGFPNHLIFYRLATDEVRILAVLHGRRDVQRILGRRA